MAYIRCAGDSGGSIQKKTATGAVATFNTGLPAPLIDVTSAIGYRSNGYTSATVINSKTTPVIDETPYHTRIAPSNIGNMALEKLVGVSCVFNQLWSEYTSIDGDYASITKNADNDYTLTVAQSSSVSESWRYGIHDTLSGISLISGHKYLFTGYFTASFNTQIRFLLGDEFILDTLTTNVNKKVGVIKECGSNSGLLGFIEVTFPNMYNSNIGDTVRVKNFNIFDLTAMFGSEVADYLYTLESGTAGAGVSIFKSLFGADYYPYTANTLMSAKPTGKKIYSKNLFNGTYDTIFQLPFVLKKGTTITASAKMVGTGTAYIQYLNASQTMIDYWGLSSGTDRKYRTFTLDADTYYFKFTSVEVTEMQIEINGEATAYEPYSETTIVYSGNELRGLLKVGTNGLYADGDIDDGSGSTSGRCDICDFSDNEWSYKDGLFSTQIPNFKSPTSYNDRKTGFLFEDYYLPDSQISISSASMNDKRALRFNERIYIKDTAFSDAVSFTAHMNNVKMLYELATPTTATSTAWSNPIQAKQGGTETFVDGNFYGCVDLGSLNYSYDSPYSRFIATVPNNRTYTTAETPNLIVSGYKAVSIDYFDGHLSESMMICGDNNSTAIYIRNLDYTDATAFKNAMSGTYLFYEISTSTFELPTGHDTIYGTDMVVKKADFGQTVYGGSVDFTTGEVISNKNADGSDKTPEAIAISPVMVGVFEGNNNIVTTAGGNNTVKYYKGA